MDPTITKASTGKERLVSACAESQSTSRGPNRTRFLTVQAAIRAKMQCDKKCLLEEADTSKKRNLMAVGGHADNAVDLCAEDNADAKRQCLGKGQTMLTKQPSLAEFEECWSEVIIKNFCRREMDEGIKKDLWSGMEDFSKAPGGKDFSKMKAQYAMFVDAVASKQVCVSICMTLHLRITLSNSTDNIVCTASF
jgi:hypothetical protein